MSFQAAPMFKGDLHDAAQRFAASVGSTLTDPQAAAGARARAWAQATEMGWPAVLVPDALGGAGGTLLDLAAIVEATGRHALALPLVERCAVVPTLLALLTTPGAAALLARIADGTADVACAVQPHRVRDVTLSERGDGAWELEGTALGIDMTVPASHVLLHLPASQALVLLDAAQVPAAAVRYQSIDGRETADIAFHRLRVDASALPVQGCGVQRAVDKALDIGALMTCVEVVAALGGLLEQTIDYLKTRIQFGVHLSTFQALRHRVVEMYVQYESASGLIERILHDGVDAARIDDRDVSLAKAYLGKLGRFGAEAAIQLHGGMGMTEELLTARLAERVLGCEYEYGDRFSHLTRLARRRPLSARDAGDDRLQVMAA